MTVSILKSLKGEIQAELEELFPEYTVSNLRVTVPARNEISIKANIGAYPVDFLGNAAILNELNMVLNRALKDLGVSYPPPEGSGLASWLYRGFRGY